ncbi:hypothetical protein DICPUDRAFT_94142 [Dictyostelium purpureum]|uniref:Kinesin motor domain-containing protein n=1 Tax=Dictyostelium purpureum TaxID=5786 RepID=F0ZFY2_DICPU|nr:uncharacterized protein DICPUDRAFT_94142 [Dictyostelium purpureum]EGC37120.1 hypothetical protein DICPUDRAFT_94142 [Dictyostelium purpureum]|eukprot:XP_003286323.1 hypothetical protein DICPUDRAFT_94142 [Dictyostelium purpureum]
MSSIRVVCRFRPQNKNELAQGGCSIVSVAADNQSVSINGAESNHTFTFDRVFHDQCTQKEVYDDAAKPVIEDIMAGYNGTIFVYGQTSSGKTHTMQGPSIDDQELKGVIPRMIQTVFECISNADENIEFIVKASYIEIYMERIRDLLDTKKDNLKVREEKGKGVWVDGTTEAYIYGEHDILNVIRNGQANRAIAETKMNAESSRSHSIFILTIQQKNLKEGSVKTGKLYLVDLAGSEKISKTGAQGLTLDEAKMINKSLSSLGNVINALTDGKSAHIPYRDSKLTRVLQESLGGNSRTTLIINCSPSSYNEAETVSTLRFGSRAKNIKNKAKINQERSAAELKILLSKAENEIESLKGYIKELESVGGAPRSSGSQSASSASANSENDQALKALQEKCISLEKQLFKKEEEKRELLEQLEIAQEQIQDKDQELEAMNALRDSANKYSSLYQTITNENSVLNTQISEMKLILDKSRFEISEQALTIEGLQSENQSIKSEFTILQEKFSKQSSNPGNDASVGRSEVSPSSRTDREDPSAFVSKHADEWEEKAEQLKLLQRTPSKAVAAKSSKSIVGGSNAGANSSPIISLNISEDINGNSASTTAQSNNEQVLEAENQVLKDRIKEIEHEFESYRIAKENLAMQKDLEIEQLLESQRISSSFVVDPRNLDDELPAEMMLQAEQLRKLVSENSEQKVHLETVRHENTKLKSRIEDIEEETRQRMEEELNLLREQTNLKLLEFGTLKESLLRDLENRCQKVIDLELVLDEYQDRNATLTDRLKRANKPGGNDQETMLIQTKLDEMTSLKHQLNNENNKLKSEIDRLKKLHTLRGEHIISLENTIAINQENQYKLAINHQTLTVEFERIKNELERVNSNQPENSGARVARVIRGGGGNSGSAHLTSNNSNTASTNKLNYHTTPTPLTSNLYNNTKKSTKELNNSVKAEPLILSGSPFNQSPNSLVGANSNTIGGSTTPGRTLNSENSSSSIWNSIFKKKSPSSTPSSSTNSLTPPSPSNINNNTSPLVPPQLSPPIPVSFNYTSAAVPTSPANKSNTESKE